MDDGTSALDDFEVGLAGLVDTATTVVTWGEFGTDFAADEAAAADAHDQGLGPDEAEQLKQEYEATENSSDVLGQAAGDTIDEAPGDVGDAAGSAVDAASSAATKVARAAGKAVGAGLGAVAPGLGSFGKAAIWILLPLALVAGLVLVLLLAPEDVAKKGMGKGKKK